MGNITRTVLIIKQFITFSTELLELANGTTSLGAGTSSVVGPDVNGASGRVGAIAARVCVDDVHELGACAVQAALDCEGAVEERTGGV